LRIGGVFFLHLYTFGEELSVWVFGGFFWGGEKDLLVYDCGGVLAGLRRYLVRSLLFFSIRPLRRILLFFPHQVRGGPPGAVSTPTKRKPVPHSDGWPTASFPRILSLERCFNLSPTPRRPSSSLDESLFFAYSFW